MVLKVVALVVIEGDENIGGGGVMVVTVVVTAM